MALARTGLTPAELDALLAAIADDRGRAVIANPELDWLFCPYDGGVDVILPTAEARDVLRDRHRDWLSSGSDGL